MARCPKCESANVVKIAFRDYNGLFAIPYIQRKKMLPKHSGISALACVKCGNIFELTLEEPEKLAPFVGIE